jgi:hypothetical protein
MFQNLVAAKVDWRVYYSDLLARGVRTYECMQKYPVTDMGPPDIGP